MSGRVRILVAGVTESGAALEAALLGCDGVAFDFRPATPRTVTPADAREIGERLPPFVTRVGRFGTEPVIRVLQVVREAGLTAVWFDAPPPPATDALAPIPWIGSFPYRPGFDAEGLREMDCTTFVLKPEAWGAERPDWGRAKGASLYGRAILASVPPEEAEWAVRRARPYGLCLDAEYEFEPGRLDLERVEDLVDAVRAAEPWLRGAERE
jgi:phosphoribosylanthranilate isomerase